MPATLSIRRAARRDVPTILRLIRGLAEYERLAPPDGGDRRADPPPRLRAAALLRDTYLPARPHAHRLRALLLHVLDVPRPAHALPRGPLRPDRGARQRSGQGAASGAREGRGATRLRPHGVDGPRLVLRTHAVPHT